jgi:hypothetical protein
MSNSQLIPTQIVDKNGKRTTVRKRAAAPSATGKKLPAPALASTSKSASGTPLSFPKPLTETQKKAFLDGSPLLGTSYSNMNWDHMLHTRISNEDLAIIKDFLDKDRLPVDTVKAILANVSVEPRMTVTSNALLAMEAVRLRGGLPEDPSAQRATVISMMASVRGLHRNQVSGASSKLTTTEQVNGAAAVVLFINSFENDWTAKEQHVVKNNGTMVSQNSIRNVHLDALIREQPDRLDDILGYIAERGMHKRSKGPVEDLRQFLKDSNGARAIAEGWL